MVSSRTTSLPLLIIIVGGGIAGLASAFTLRKAGHQVLVLEQGSGPAKGGGGMRSPPNMTRILMRWGLGRQLAAQAIKGSEISFRLTRTGEKVGAMVFHEEIMNAFGADWLLIQYDDLYSWVYSLAKSAGAMIRFSSHVVSVDPSRASIVLSTGETIRGDLIIGADGLSSVVRRSITGRAGPTLSTGRQLYVSNTSIPSELMKSDHSLHALLREPKLNMWMGDGFAIYGSPVSGYRNYCVTIAAPIRRNREGHSVRFDIDYTTLEPRLQKLLGLVRIDTVTPQLSDRPLESLIHDSNKVILVGAAAHLIPDGQTQNVAMGIEDAAILGNLFSRLRSPDQLPSLVSAYEEIRLPRAAEVLASEIGKLDQVTFLDGSELQAIRDKGLRAALSQAVLAWDQADEEMLREQWEEHIHMFDYDADEVAEDWWIKWGNLMDVGRQNRQEESRLQGPFGGRMHICVSQVSDAPAPRRMGMRA